MDTSLDYLLMDTFEDNEDVINKEILKTLNKMNREERLFAMESFKMVLNILDEFK